jgi:hypothetical protein
MIVALIAVVTALVGAPIIVAALVSAARRREDRLWTLAGQAPGSVELIARRVLGLHTRGSNGCRMRGLTPGSGRQAGGAQLWSVPSSLEVLTPTTVAVIAKQIR